MSHLLVQAIRRHGIGLVMAALMGLIGLAPHLLFSAQLGSAYRGVHIAQTSNEVAYMAIMREIIDGHPRAASMPFFEYKDGIPLLPATMLHLFAQPVRWFGLSLGSVVIASKFIQMFALFFAVYLFVYDLVMKHDRGSTYEPDVHKPAVFYAVSAGLLVVLGFDVVDYRSLMEFISGTALPNGFVIWTRPVNPVAGAILLFVFLYALRRVTRSAIWFLVSAASLAAMMASYVFSWTMAAVLLGFYGLAAIVRKQWRDCFAYGGVFLLGVLFSLPYWLNVLGATRLPYYEEAAARIGLFSTHEPHVNKFILAVTIIFAAAALVTLLRHRQKREACPWFGRVPTWWWTCAALLGAAWIVYNQQIITGKEIWYYHYVFYSIPFGFVVLIALLWYVVRPHMPKLAFVTVLLIAAAASALGIFQQVSAYRVFAPIYASWQWQADVFGFFQDSAPEDCAVLTIEPEPGFWSNYILAYTHCNVYHSGENQSVLADPADFHYRYMATLRMSGVRAEDIETYVNEHRDEVEFELQYQLQRTLGYPDPRMEEALVRFPAEYRSFVGQDLTTVLNRFRIDYILSVGELAPEVGAQLTGLDMVFEHNNIFIYTWGS